MDPPSIPPAPAPATAHADVADVLEHLQREFLRRLAPEVHAIAIACARALGAEGDACEEARASLHRLAGRAGTLGAPEVTTQARALEACLAHPRTEETWRSAIRASLGSLREAACAAERRLGGTSLRAGAEAPTTTSLETVPTLLRGHVPLVALSVRDETPRKALEAMLTQFGFQVEVRQAGEEWGTTPSAWVCDIESVEALKRGGSNRRVLALLRSSSLGERLQAVRLGCSGTLLHDADAAELGAAIERLVPVEPEIPRVLVVDDDDLVAQATAVILESAGIEATILCDPEGLLETVAAVRPHLVLMDMNLPGATGLELAAVLRQDDRTVGVPIVFLTVDDEPARAVRALEVGADDFLIKPVAPDRLISVVNARLERARILRGYMDRDGLTRLLSHARTLERLEAEVASAHRRGEPLSLALLDLDHFKRVNDEHGHATGDRVLRALSTVLRRRVRRGDVVGRCGGEEFALVLPAARGADAARLVDQRREVFKELYHDGPSGPFHATFSAGIAQLQDGETATQLWERTDAALYRAKQQGRDRVVSSEGAPAR